MIKFKEILNTLQESNSKITIEIERGTKGTPYSIDGPYRRLTMSLNGKEIGQIQFSALRVETFDIDYIGISNEFRNKGYGTKLLQYFKTYSKKNRIKNVTAEVTSAGSFNILCSVFGKPNMISTDFEEISATKLKKQLPKYAVEDEDGVIDASNDKRVFVSYII